MEIESSCGNWGQSGRKLIQLCRPYSVEVNLYPVEDVKFTKRPYIRTDGSMYD
jgi:hypothetical protein